MEDIEGYEDLYKISNIGRVLSLPRPGTKGGFLELCIEKTSKGTLSERYYFNVGLYKNGIGKYFKVHRLVAKAFCHQPSPLHNQVDHIHCKGIPEDGLDNRAENLRWVKSQQNNRNLVKLTKGYGLTSSGKYEVNLTHPKTGKLQYFKCFNTKEEAINKVAEIQAQWRLQYPECY
jgi:hypothetical protein